MQVTRVEIALWTIGAVLTVLFAGVLSWQEFERRHQINAFFVARQITLPLPTPNPQRPPALNAAPKPAPISTTAPLRVGVPASDSVAIAILRNPAIKRVVAVNRGIERGESLLGAEAHPAFLDTQHGNRGIRRFAAAAPYSDIALAGQRRNV